MCLYTLDFFFDFCYYMKEERGGSMDLLVVAKEKDKNFYQDLDVAGFIFPLDGFSVDYKYKFTLDEIEKLHSKDKKCFVVINRMFFENDLDELAEMLSKIDKMNIDGILYYDDSLLELKIENNYKTNLYLNKNYMVTNSDTLNFYHHKGVMGAILSNEITYDEINNIRNNTTLELMQLLIGYPVVATSRRSLNTNSGNAKNLEVVEPKSSQHYFLLEDEFGTSFISLKRFNGCKYLNDFQKIGINYGIVYQDDLERKELINLVVLLNQGKTKEIDELLGRNRGFLNRKTIYQVKKDGKN